MARITLKPLDDGQKAVEIPVGKTTIGRGPFLGCSDKKVSRNHAVLEVTSKGEVYLTPTHVNPCFYQPTADSPGQILKKDIPHKLENGDSFSLLPRAFRYQLIVTGESTEDKSDQNDLNKQSGKTNGAAAECEEALLNERNKDNKPSKGISNEELNDGNRSEPRGSRSTDNHETEQVSLSDDSQSDTVRGLEEESGDKNDINTDSSEYQTPKSSVKKRKRNEDTAVKEVFQSMKTLAEHVSQRDNFSVYGEHVGNKLRSCGKNGFEIAIAQNHIDNILFNLAVGTYSQEINRQSEVNPQYHASLSVATSSTSLANNPSSGPSTSASSASSSHWSDPQTPTNPKTTIESYVNDEMTQQYFNEF